MRIILCPRQKIKCSHFVILAKAGIPAGSGETPLEEMDSRLRGEDNDGFVMYKDPYLLASTVFGIVSSTFFREFFSRASCWLKKAFKFLSA